MEVSAQAILAAVTIACPAPCPALGNDHDGGPYAAVCRTITCGGPNTPSLPTPPIGARLLVSASLSVAVPPCGTPEAARAGVCFNWTIVPCPRSGERWASEPIGCDALRGLGDVP